MAIDNGHTYRALMSSEMFVEYASKMKNAELEQLETFKSALNKNSETNIDIFKEALDKTVEELYDIDFPESDIEIGMISRVEPLDYYLYDIKDTECPQDKSDDADKAKFIEPATINETEITEAEKALGLDTNIFYILQKIAKGLK
jgi:hypothetical protein